MQANGKVLKNLNRNQVGTLAKKLAKKYSKQDVVIGLTGQLGAGKTAFTKEFAKALGVRRIKSPTFIIGSVYPIKSGLLYHYDFYRLEKLSQLKPLGFDEIIKSSDRIVLIEWVDKFPKVTKVCNVIINLEISGKSLRNVRVKTSNSK